jgi:putative phage-type endonuclease
MLAKIKSGWGATRANYLAELVAERLTGVPQNGYVNAVMQRGIETEPEACTAYEFYRDMAVDPVGFWQHPKIQLSGASPDGVIGSDGCVEIKCPNTATHIETLLGGSVPKKYIHQMQWQMACGNRKWCDFVSYDPRMPEDLKLFVRRIERDEKAIHELEGEILVFLQEVDYKVQQLKELITE